METAGVYGKSTAPLLSSLAKKLVHISGDPRERQVKHQLQKHLFNLQQISF